MSTIVKLLVVAALVSAAPSAAQDRSDFQLWGALFATGDVLPSAPGPSFWLDLHSRRTDAGTVTLVRPGAGITVFPWLSLWAGYAWIPTYNDMTRVMTHEHRIWEQATVQYRTEFRLTLQSRTRLEQRFSDSSGDVGLRFRQLVRANWQPSADVPVGIAFWDEIFLGFAPTAWGAPGGFDQNRLFIGPFVSPAPWTRIEVGYLFVYLDRGGADTYAHALSINLFFTYAPPAPPPAREPDPPAPVEQEAPAVEHQDAIETAAP